MTDYTSWPLVTRWLATAVSAFLFAHPATAQAPITIEPTYVSVVDGLAAPNVQDVMQDSYGLIWIATTNGIQLYDGYKFQSFKNVSGKPNSLLNNNAWDLMEDNDHNIWVGHDLGVSRYDRTKNEFINYRFSNAFNIPAGGNFGRAFDLHQDATGQIWAATTNMQIIMFDADSNKWEFAPYDETERKQEAGHYGLSLIITEGQSGLWAGSGVSGLLHKATGENTFKSVPANILGFDFTKESTIITSLYADSANTVWITTRTGVYRYYPQLQQLKILREYTEAMYDGWNQWNSIQRDSKGAIWVANNFRGILKIDPNTNTIEDVQVAGRVKMKGRGWNFTVTDFTIDRGGIFWFGTRELGILKYDPARKPFTFYAHDPTNPKSISPNGVFGLMASKTKPGFVYVGSRTEGFSILDPKTQTFEKHTYKAVDDAFNGSVRAFLEESNGALWLGTWGDGIIQLDPKLQEVRRFKNNEEDEEALSNNQIRVLRKDPQGRIWAGTNFGLNIIDPATGTIDHVAAIGTRTYDRKLTTLLSSMLADSKATAIIDKVVDNQHITIPITIPAAGKYILVTVGEGDLESMADYGWITTSTNDTIWNGVDYDKTLNVGGAAKNRIEVGFIEMAAGTYTLHYRSDDSHSFGKWNEPAPTLLTLYGVALFKPANDAQVKEIESMMVPKPEWITIGSNISDIEFQDKYAWVGNMGNVGGLNRIDLTSTAVEHFLNDPNNPNSLSGNNITSLFIDRHGILWITTNEGLNRFDPKTKTFTRFGETDGLPTNLTEGIVEGDDGQLWIATQNGISQLISNESMGKVTFINYQSVDGLGGDVFLPQACDRATDGRFYFGGDHGLTTFSEVTPNATPPSIVISNILVANQSVLSNESTVKINGSLLNASQLNLSFDQNNLSFEFAALHYTNSKRNQYAHKLEGYDKDWVYDNRNFASYTNLDPGTYAFIVRASNANGVWNVQGRSIVIVIQPPWWKTWWAYSLYLVILGFGIFFIDRFMRARIKRIERERSREKELAQAQEIEKAYNNLKATQNQLIHSEKMASLGELTAGIAHEIQNPLNFVNNFSEVNKELLQELTEEIDKGNYSEANAIAKSLVDNEEKIIFHGKRADSIVKGMLQHSRTSSGVKEATDINALADEYLRLAYHGLRAKDKTFNAAMKTDLDPHIGKVNVVPQDLGRVILNLITNGFYAVTEKRKAAQNGYEPTVIVSTRKSGDKVQITVRDNGNGIPTNIIDKIFQPFFTTKPSGHGTGLGLSMSYDIVTKVHGGKIDVETSPGEGTSFILTIPNLTA